MKNLELFNDFIELSYTEGIRREDILDVNLNNFNILRRTWFGYTINYLTKGTSLLIPWKWIDIFSGLYVYSGDRILFNGKELCGDYYEDFILLSIRLQEFSIETARNIDGNLYLEVLSELCSLGTKKFRNLLKDKYNIDVDPFEYYSCKGDFDI